MTHTPEPWNIGTAHPNGEQTIGHNGLMVAVTTTGYGVNSFENARRIVACVNACAGYTTEKLESACLVLLPREEFRRALIAESRNNALIEQIIALDAQLAACEVAKQRVEQQRDDLQSQIIALDAQLDAITVRCDRAEQQCDELLDAASSYADRPLCEYRRKALMESIAKAKAQGFRYE